MAQNYESEYYYLQERQFFQSFASSKLLIYGKNSAQKMKSKWLSIVAILALAVSICFVLPASRAHAATITSTATGGAWATGGTWVGGIAPAVGDTVIIATTGANSVTIGAAVTQTAAGSVTVTSGATLTATAANITFGALTINSTGIFNCSRVLTVLGATNITGTINLQTTVRANVFNGDVTLNSGAVWNETVANTPTFSGNFTNNATTFTASTGVYTFNGAAKTLSGSTTTSIPTVTFPAGSSYTNSGTLTVGTLLTVTGTGVLTNNGTINATTALSGTGGVTQGTTGILNIGGTSGITTLTATASGNIVNYNGAAQTIHSNNYSYLTLSGSNTKTAGGSFTIAGDLTITGVTLASAATVQTVNGNINNTGTHTATTGSITLNGGTSTHILSGTGIYANLVMNDTLGATLTGSPTVSGVLTLTNGDISTGANIMQVSATCATGISGYSANSYVFGNLLLHYPTAAGTTTCTFPIGDATTYAPVTVAMVGVTSTLANSTLTARTDTPDHPDTTSGTSGIDKNYSVNRYWTLTPGGSLTFTTYNPTFTFVAGDIDSGATTANFIIARKDTLSVWSYPTMGTKTATSTQATGITQANGFGTFAVGETSSISGTIFEDINYGGGAGRSLAGSAGVPVAGVRVEMYNNSGAYVTTATTNASGVYRFSQNSGTYTVRIASNGAIGIRSTRTGGAACTTCVPVQTYRTDASSGTAVAVTDHVGGETPTLVDAGDNTTSATLASLTTGTTTAQSITSVAKGTANITGIDFGFNFDTIVSIRDSSQGSLRQFIVNANALGGEGSLSQTGQTSGQETSIFMIPNGAANPGQNTGYANQLATSGANAGTAVITLASVLPTISGANTGLDATTQTTNVGDTNPGTVGTGGTVGTMAQTLQPFNRPEVVISAAATQLTASGATVIIKGLAVANGGITVNGNNSQVRDCLSGMNADGTVTTIYSATYGIIGGTGTGILISHNYVKVNNSGIRGDSPGANLTIEYNEVGSPTGTPGGGHTNTFDGILTVNSATNVTVRYNLSKNQRGGGIEFGFGTGVITGTALGNTVVNNGYASASTPSTEPIGIACWSLATGSSITIQQNVITGNAGTGVMVSPSAAQVTSGIIISRNSIYSNGSIGIDLNPNTAEPNNYVVDGVTLNDMNDADTGPNGLLNYPIIQSAIISGSNLILSGWARPGSAIEFFISDPNSTGFGSGKTYLTTLTEGSVADTAATAASTYGPGAINGILQGTDTTNRFQFTIPVPGGVAVGTILTATATLSGNTSEFSGNVAVITPPVLTVVKSANPNSSVAPGQVVTYTVQVFDNSGGTATSVVLTDQLSPYVSWSLNAFGAGIPFSLTQGSPASGLTLGTPVYSNDHGATWTYVPSGTYDGNVTNWQIPMSGTMNAGGANFTINYKVRVN